MQPLSCLLAITRLTLIIRRKDSLFETNPLGIAWADPVECLLDLHEMRLEPQALEFLNFLKTGKHNS